MSRRGGARCGRRGMGGGATLFSAVLALAAGRPVFTADYYALDGVSGKVAAFIDWNDPTHVCAQSTGANQCALPAAHADFGNKPCVTTTGNEAYQSNRSTAYWSLCSDGVSVETTRIFTPLAGAGTRMLDATAFAGTQKGHQAFWAAGGNQSLTYITPTGLAVNAGSLGPVGQDVPTYTSVRFEQAGTNQWELWRKSALVTFGSYAFPPGASPSQVPLTLFSNAFPSPSLGGTMRWRGLLVGPALSPAQRAVNQSWILQDAGIAP